MIKILIGLLAAIVIAAGGFFGFEFYVQQRVAGEVEAAFAQVRAAGGKASHGKVSFDLWTRTITVADIAGESAAKPPVAVKIGQFTAAGVSQPDTARFVAEKITAANIEVAGTLGTQAGLQFTYQAPSVEISDYSGPAGPQRQVDTSAAADIYRFALEHFAAVSAKSVTAPRVAAKYSGTGTTAPAGSGEYTYSNLALRDIKEGKVASSTVERVAFTAQVNAAGKSENFTGEIANLAAYDFDAAATLMMLDPAHAKDDKYYRAYRQMTAGTYKASFQQGLRMQVDGMSIDDVGVRPSRLQFTQLMAIVESAPPPGTTPTPEQTRDLLGKIAGIYEGIRVGGAQVRGLLIETPEGAFKMAALRVANLENGKIAEVAIEGLDAKAPQGPVKIGRFALKSLDIANLMRMAGQLSTPGQKPAPDQLLALLTLLDGAEMKGLVAPYKDATKPVNVDTLDLAWGQFVGPIPSRLRVTVKISGPVDAADPDPFKMLAAAGIDTASVNLDFGAAWNEGAKSFALDPASVEIGSVATAAARISLANVPREVFSLNPLQAAIMAAQIEAGTIELAVRDIGGVDLAIAQKARAEKISPEAAKRAMIETIKANGMTMASVNPDAMAIAGAVTRFIENPRGTLTIKLIPKGKVAMMQLIDALKGNPLAALARFEVDARTGR